MFSDTIVQTDEFLAQKFFFSEKTSKKNGKFSLVVLKKICFFVHASIPKDRPIYFEMTIQNPNTNYCMFFGITSKLDVDEDGELPRCLCGCNMPDLSRYGFKRIMPIVTVLQKL